MSSSLLGKRAREESDETETDRLFEGRDIVTALRRFLEEPGEKEKGHFERFISRFKSSEIPFSRGLLVPPDVENVIFDFTATFLPFDPETSEMLKQITDEKMSNLEYDAFMESSLAKFLAPNLFVQWIKRSTDERFVSNLFLALCSDPSNPIEYYLSNRENMEKVEDYLFQLRISNAFEFMYLFMRLGECQSIEKNFFGKSYPDSLLRFFKDLTLIGVTGYNEILTPVNNVFNTFYAPFFKHFIEEKHWDECMAFFLTNPELKARNLNYSFLIYENAFFSILNTPEMIRRIQTGHAPGELTRGYYKVLEQVYEFAPYFIIYLLKTNLYELYDQKIINHLVQKYINLITLILLGGRNEWEYYFDSVKLDVIINAIQNYSRRTGFVFHISFIQCPTFDKEPKHVDFLYRWFQAIPVSGAIMKMYRAKCPQIFGSPKWYEKESTAAPRSLTDRVFYYCFF